MFNITNKYHVAVLLYVMLMSYVQADIGVDVTPRANATVREGVNVTFVCDLRNVVGYSILWTYSGSRPTLKSYLTRDRGLYEGEYQAGKSVRSRLSIVGDVDEEEFSLRIQNVQGSDSGQYSCRYVLLADGGTLTIVGMATLTVLIPPSQQSPICTVNRREGSPETGFTVGDQVNLVCSTSGGNTRPNITITTENKIVVEAYQILYVTHPYTLQAEDNGVVFTCTMTTPALDAPRTCSAMPLMILPVVTISPVLSTVEEGAIILLECNADGVPSIYNVIWKVFKTNSRETLASDKYLLSTNGQTLSMQVIENIELYCIASVPSGLSNNSTVRIEVTPREETTTEEMNTQAYTMDPHQTTCSSSPVTTISVVVSVVVVIFVIMIILLIQWQRRKKRKSKIPIGPKETGRRSETKSNDETIYDQDGYVLPNISNNFLYEEVEQGKPLGSAPASTLLDGTVDSPHDMSAISYLQPNKPKKTKHHKADNENMYDVVVDEEEHN